MNPFGDPDVSVERERHLAELLRSVHQAQHLARTLCNSRDSDSDSELKLLFIQLEAVRIEVQQLRRGQCAVPLSKIDPKWTGLLPWRTIPEC